MIGQSNVIAIILAAFAMFSAFAPAAIIEGGRFGGALHPGETYAAAPPLSAMYCTTPRTIECWARIGASDDYTILLAYEPKSSIEHWELFADKKTGKFTSFMTGYQPQLVTSDVNITDGHWHYLAMVMDGSRVELFVDARKVADQGVRRQRGWSDTGSLMFGHADHTPVPKNLLLDEVRLSSSKRLIDHVPDQAFAPDKQTLGLWHFDESAEDDQFADASLNRNRAHLANGDEEFAGSNPVSQRWQEEDHGPFFSSSLSANRPVPNDTNKGISIRLGADRKAGLCFDTELLRVSAAWTGGFIKIYGGRDGLAQHPDPLGKIDFGCIAAPGWSDGNDFTDPRPDHVGPLPRERGKYKGLYLHGDRVILAYNVFGADVLETYDLIAHADRHAFLRTVQVSPSDKALTMTLVDQPGSVADARASASVVSLRHKDDLLVAGVISGNATLQADNDHVRLAFAPHKESISCQVMIYKGSAGDGATQFQMFVDNLKKTSETGSNDEPPKDLSPLIKGGPARWGDPVQTRGVLGKEAAPYVVDELTPPVDNPYKSYLRFGGLDFFKNGDAAVCSVSGDVWIVSGIDTGLQKLTWRRYATGLFQPLGLRIVNDVVYVLGRDQITRLHDLNGDGEADFYECFNNDCKVTAGGHEYCTSLETDPAGNFYYTKCGNPTDHGGTMLKVSPEGSTLSVFATGLRNPNGMGVSPTGIVTTSDNEGEWVPASRVDFVHAGQFLGFTPEAHGHTADGPGNPIWIPHSIDNSSGGQVWNAGTKWGPLEGALLHTSYGASSLFLMLPEVVNGKFQGGSFRLPLKFSSGIMRARFNPIDGQLYVCGLKGWQTNGVHDAALQRVRFTGKPVCYPTELHAYRNGIRLTFSSAIDPKLASDVGSWGVSQWNYRWTSAYGSYDWSVADPQKQGHDAVDVKAVQVSNDAKTVFLEIPTLGPVMQMQVQYQLATPDGMPAEGSVYNTIAALRPPLSAGDLDKPVESGIAP